VYKLSKALYGLKQAP
jgi:hypothetical protein